MDQGDSHQMQPLHRHASPARRTSGTTSPTKRPRHLKLPPMPSTLSATTHSDGLPSASTTKTHSKYQPTGSVRRTGSLQLNGKRLCDEEMRALLALMDERVNAHATPFLIRFRETPTSFHQATTTFLLRTEKGASFPQKLLWSTLSSVMVMLVLVAVVALVTSVENPSCSTASSVAPTHGSTRDLFCSNVVRVDSRCSALQAQACFSRSKIHASRGRNLLNTSMRS